MAGRFGDTTHTKVFVGGLAWETQKDTMKKYFEEFGDVLEAVVITDKATGRSKGYGFVTFREAEAAMRACVDPAPVIDGRRANCNLASLGVRRSKPSTPKDEREMDERLKKGIQRGKEMVSKGRIDTRKFQPGDHIFIKRAFSLYSHHGIYIGNGYVIHHTVEEKSCSKLIAACPKCGYRPAKDHGILKTCLDCFIYEDSLICTDHSVNLYQYGVTSVEYAIKSAGSCSRQSSNPPEEVVKIANELYKNGFGEYSLIFNNCEDFATYCKTGVGSSSQVNFAAVKTVAGLAFGAATLAVVAIDYFKTRRQKKQVLESAQEDH